MAEVNVNDGEIITGSQVLAGDTLNVSNGGLAENTVVSGGTAVIAAGGSANVMDVYGDSVSGVSGTVDLAGNATSVTLNSGGVLNVNNGGVATSAKIFSGSAVVSSGGTIDGGAVYFGSMTVSLGGQADGIGVYTGGALALGGGSADNATIYDGGSMGIGAGTATDVTVYKGGMLGVVDKRQGINLLPAPSVEGAVISSGGAFFVQSGGHASATVVDLDGNMVVTYSGTASDTSVSGGRLQVSSGGIASGTVVYENGMMNVAAETNTSNTSVTNIASAIYTTVSNGGGVSVGKGGQITSTHVSAGGSLSIGFMGSADYATPLAAVLSAV